MIIFRYLRKETYLTMSVVTVVLLLIFLCNQFVRFLSRAAAGKISATAVFKIMALQVPYLIGLLLPVGLFLGILLAYGRLYTDNEMTVLSACGFSKRNLVFCSLRFSILVAVVVAGLVLWVNPQLMAYQLRLKTASPAESILETAMPGRFQMMPGGKQVYYVEDVSRDRKQINHIFVAEQEKSQDAPASQDGHVWNVLFAKKGYELNENGDIFMVAEEGFRYFGTPGEKDFQVAQFDQYGLRLDNQVPEIHKPYLAMSNRQLWERRDTDKHAWPELQWRIIMPLSVPILALLAVPFSYVRPRQGRYAKLLPAVLVYTIYANMMFVARSWVENQSITPTIGLWWLPVLLLLLGLFMLFDGRNFWLKYRLILSGKKTC